MRVPVPFLWLCGPSGVGKSTVAWEIFSQLDRAGIASAYVDADQLGLCYPAESGDPGNHRVKAGNLGAVWPAFRTAGVTSMVMSGGVDSADEVRTYTDRVPGAAVTLCRLRAGSATLRERFVRRGWMTHLVGEALALADTLERVDVADVCVDTDGLPAAAVARLVRERAGGWPSCGDPGASHASAAPGASAGPGGSAGPGASPGPVGDGSPVPVLLLCGPAAVGKSTVGYEVFTRLHAGRKAAYVDLAQVGFCRPAPVDDPDNHRLKAANLAAMWPAFRDAGARFLIATGRVNDAAALRVYTQAMPTAAFTVCRLNASPETLTDRVLRRGRGEGPAILGDEMRGQPAGRLRQIAQQAVRDGDRLRRARIGDLSVDTDDRCVADVVRVVTAAYSPVLERLLG